MNPLNALDCHFASYSSLSFHGKVFAENTYYARDEALMREALERVCLYPLVSNEGETATSKIVAGESGAVQAQDQM